MVQMKTLENSTGRGITDNTENMTPMGAQEKN